MKAQETITIDLTAYEADRNADHGDAERRIHNLEHALGIAEEDNATLRMRIAELEAERDELEARAKELEHEANKYAAICNDLHKEVEELHVSKYEDDA